MPLCVAGMHRSGTSLVARLLAASGLYCGPPEELVAPAPDNAEGFWENIRFLRLNDEILARFGGFWDRPPTMPPGWASDRRLSRLRRDAAALVDRFRGQEPWFWKDPRNSLTLPFWREVVPDLRIVLCVRAPLEVVASLDRRGQASGSAGWALWRTYNRGALATAPLERRVVTHYDAYLHDAPAELRRVADVLGIPISAERIVRACAMLSPRAGPRVPAAADVDAVMPPEAAALYRDLCAEAGPVCQRALAGRAGQAGPRLRGTSLGGRGTGRGARGPSLWAARAVRRVWRQEGVRTLARVLILKVRRRLALAREALGDVVRPGRRWLGGSSEAESGRCPDVRWGPGRSADAE